MMGLFSATNLALLCFIEGQLNSVTESFPEMLGIMIIFFSLRDPLFKKTPFEKLVGNYLESSPIKWVTYERWADTTRPDQTKEYGPSSYRNREQDIDLDIVHQMYSRVKEFHYFSSKQYIKRSDIKYFCWSNLIIVSFFLFMLLNLLLTFETH